jgi:hypothetical protein
VSDYSAAKHEASVRSAGANHSRKGFARTHDLIVWILTCAIGWFPLIIKGWGTISPVVVFEFGEGTYQSIVTCSKETKGKIFFMSLVRGYTKA